MQVSFGLTTNSYICTQLRVWWLININNSIHHYSFTSTQLNCSKLLNCTANYSIKHELFVYMQWNCQTVLFLTIRFNVSLFARNLNVKVLFDPQTGANPVPIFRVRVDLGVISKGYFLYPKPSPSDCLMPYPGDPFGGGGSYSSPEMLSVYSTAQVWLGWNKSHQKHTHTHTHTHTHIYIYIYIYIYICLVTRIIEHRIFKKNIFYYYCSELKS